MSRLTPITSKLSMEAVVAMSSNLTLQWSNDIFRPISPGFKVQYRDACGEIVERAVEVVN